MRRRTHRLAAGLLTLGAFALTGCSRYPESPTPDPDGPSGPQLSIVAEAYLTNALDVMETHSVRRLEIDWPAFRATTLDEAYGAVTRSDTYGAIHSAVERIGDGHSRFVEPGGFAGALVSATGRLRASASTETGTDGARGGRLGASVGYLSVPGFRESTEEAMTGFATALQRAIREADGEDVCSWIVDLRGNGGGNMWPMLAGVGPILGEGEVGAFVDPEGEIETWLYEDGGSALRLPGGSTRVIAQVDGTPYQPVREPSAIAVLTSRGTLSSGEAIAIAFRGHPAASSMGQPTGGRSTGVEGFAFDDGAVLGLATSRMADRTGRAYGEEVPPDATVEPEASGDPALERAYAAVAAAADCAGPEELSGAPDADLAGEWSGVGNMGGILRFDLEIAGAETTVEGTATLTLGPLVESCALEGDRSGADLAMTLDCPSGPVRFAGLATDPNTLVGVLHESLPDVAFSFEKIETAPGAAASR